jgi:uncharacterized protein
VRNVRQGRASNLSRVSRPIRTCVGCRVRGNKADLIRVVARDGVGVVDPAQTEPGRGVYLHPSRDCLDRAMKRRSIGRSLRAEIDGPQTAQVISVRLDAVT